MKYGKYLTWLMLASVVLVVAAACRPSAKRRYVIGVSQCMLNDAWRQAMVREMRLEASNYDDIELIVYDGQSDNDTQIGQIRDLIRRRVDVLIISPFQSQPITAVAEEAFRAGIPTIITDRKVNTDCYTTFVGADNYAIGRAAGRYSAERLPAGATVLEIWGMASSSPAQERHQGFIDALSEAHRTDVSFVRIEGDWLYSTARARLDTLQWLDEVDFVYSHNDMMAIAARELLPAGSDTAQGRAVTVIGVDAVPGAGLEAVADGRIDASFLYPTGGEQVIRAAVDLLHGKPVDRYIPLQTGRIDRPTAQTLLIQAGRLQNYQAQIERQRANLDALFGRFTFLQHSLATITALTVGLVLLSLYAFSINRKLKSRNSELREINRKEEEQRAKLLSLNAEIKEVTAQKLQFFTNVSHEIRTPLTLILDPLARLAAELPADSPHRAAIGLMQKNVARLHRVVNQILEFRKVENEPAGTLQLAPTDLTALAREVMSYFDQLAADRHIDYRFAADADIPPLDADADKMEKVVVNLLSNAFKFTPPGGRIALTLRNAGEAVQIDVEDNGSGIAPDRIPYLFERFYTDGGAGGTGIGLYLAKRYVEMHGGDIAVESTPGRRTCFAVRIPKEVRPSSVAIEQPAAAATHYDAERLDDSETRTLLSQQYPYTILVADDDDEVRNYLKEELERNFRVITAANGREAIDHLRRSDHDVSLVLSDVMMPEMNGYELCRAIKADDATAHLPVILLTALAHDRQQLYGLSGGADDYLQKPFRTDLVKVKIIRLLAERERLSRRLLRKLQDDKLLLVEPDRTMSADDAFLKRLIDRIEEVYTDSDYNVERLSDALALSRGHLYRRVKELAGVTPVEFLRNYRLSRAALLLKERRYTVSEVAYRTGFSSPAYFAKCFRIAYGVTPTNYEG